MKFRALAVAALALFLPFAAVACSDDSTGDLSVSDMSKELQEKGGMDKKSADCIAKALKDADFTKDELESMADAKDLSSDKMKAYTDAAMKCLTGGTDLSTPTSGG